MRRLAAFFCLWASQGAAADTVSAGGDTILIREAEGVAAEVVYSNSLLQNSVPGTYTVDIAGVVVDVTLEIGGARVGSKETVHIVPRDSGLIAIPAEVSVSDGEMAVVQIMTPLF